MILIVDDNQSLRSALKKWLNFNFTSYQVLEAATGEEAIILAQTYRPDVVLMDITLPNLNGIEATRQIKASVPETQVVIISYHDTSNYLADAVAAGSIAYIVKSQVPQKLLPLLQSLLYPSATPSPLS